MKKPNYPIILTIARKTLDKPIAIIPENRDKITEAIRKAEGRAKVRTITVADIEKAVYCLRDHLHNISKSALKGVKVTFNLNAQTFPSAYKYTPESTWIDLEHNGKDWRITGIYRTRCGNTKCYIELTDEAEEKILKNIIEF